MHAILRCWLVLSITVAVLARASLCCAPSNKRHLELERCGALAVLGLLIVPCICDCTPAKAKRHLELDPCIGLPVVRSVATGFAGSPLTQ